MHSRLQRRKCGPNTLLAREFSNDGYTDLLRDGYKIRLVLRRGAVFIGEEPLAI